jgi:hypothetical protein
MGCFGAVSWSGVRNVLSSFPQQDVALVFLFEKRRPIISLTQFGVFFGSLLKFPFLGWIAHIGIG